MASQAERLMDSRTLSLDAPRRARLAARRIALGVASLAAAAALTVVPSSTASAQRVELPVNELAAEITASASHAVEALETFRLTGAVEDQRMLAWHRATTARYVAQQLGYDEFAMIDAWSRASLDHQRAVLGALTQVGVPYRTNASVEGEGFDCSGLTSYAWEGAGVELFRQSGSQISDAEPRTRETAMAGDLVHYPGHVMMYLGVEDAVVHSVNTGRTVEVDTISERRRDRVSFGDPLAGSSD
ncbi:MAG: NlpC/P60 family protein [Actinomycetota bacterium]